MALEEWKIRGGRNRPEERVCKLYGKELEDIVNFMVKSEALEGCRDRRIMGRASTNDLIEATGEILFETKDEEAPAVHDEKHEVHKILPH